MSRLEVCQGPDCFGSGGGAAIVELEELVQEYKNGDGVVVVRGGCRNFCSMGPNVHFNQQHFTKVNGVQECRSVLGSTEPSPTLVATKLLLRRADQQRWQCLRQMARLKAARRVLPQEQVQRVKTQLEACLELESRAVRNNSELHGRATRRAGRLRLSLERIVQENSELSDDSDSSSEEETDATRAEQTD